MDIGLVRNAKFVEKNKNQDCWRIPSLSVVQSGCGSSVFLLLLFKELKIGLSENSVFNVYHPDAVELYSVCNSLSKVQKNIVMTNLHYWTRILFRSYNSKVKSCWICIRLLIKILLQGKSKIDSCWWFHFIISFSFYSFNMWLPVCVRSK